MNTQHHKNRSSRKVWFGLALLVIGFIILLRNLNFFVPHWLVSWPMILIIIGVANGMSKGFQRPSSFVLILLGAVFLSTRIIPDLDLHHILIPVLFIALGLYFIIGKRKTHIPLPTDPEEWDKKVIEGDTTEKDVSPSAPNASIPGEDYLDTVAIFGGVKKNVMSKNFIGGQVVAIMGGIELNLIQADFDKPAVLEVVQVFGGTKIIIPANWKVVSEMAAVFGGIDDKRPVASHAETSDKLLIIKGTSIFGGIEIRSF